MRGLSWRAACAAWRRHLRRGISQSLSPFYSGHNPEPFPFLAPPDPPRICCRHKCRLAAVHLLEMGFEWSTALAAVEAAGGSADLAVHLLTGAALEGVPDCAPANVTK